MRLDTKKVDTLLTKVAIKSKTYINIDISRGVHGNSTDAKTINKTSIYFSEDIKLKDGTVFKRGFHEMSSLDIHDTLNKINNGEIDNTIERSDNE